MIVGHLVAGDPLMGGGPADDVVVSREYPGTDLHGSGSKALVGGDGVGSHPIDGSRGVHKNWLSVAIFLSLVERADDLVCGIGLPAEGLLMVVAASGPPARGPPDTCCSHLSAVQTPAVGPDCDPGPAPSLPRGLKSLLSSLDDNLAGEPSAVFHHCFPTDVPGGRAAAVLSRVMRAATSLKTSSEPSLPRGSRKVVENVRVCGVDTERMPKRRDAERMRWQVEL